MIGMITLKINKFGLPGIYYVQLDQCTLHLKKLHLRMCLKTL